VNKSSNDKMKITLSNKIVYQTILQSTYELLRNF